MQTWMDWGREVLGRYGLSVGGGLVTLIVGWFVAKMAGRGAGRALKRAGTDPTLAGFCASLIYVTMLVVVVITALATMGVPTVSFAVVLGSAGLAIGLALKGMLSNLAAGVMLIALRPFEVGDTIEVAGASGVVEQIRVFATTLKAADETRIIVPNASITGGNIKKQAPPP